jgi:phospholipid transport system substrate-binding protein
MGRIAMTWVLVVLLCVIGGSSRSLAADQNNTAPAADPPPTARAVIEKVTQEALAVLRDHSLSADQKRDRVKQIAYDHISFEVMARLSLGRYLRGLTDDQRTQYEQEFKQYVTNTYGHTTDNYTDEDVIVYGDRQEQDGDVTVRTRLTGTVNGTPNQEVAKVDYRLRKQDDQWKVIDFTIEGVSLVSNFRSQFQEIMTEGGIDRLLKLLQDKNAANEAAISTPK